jgi:hypothetical protein
MADGEEERVRWAVRESRRRIRWHDPAKFRARWKSRFHAKPPSEYDTPALAVATAMLEGAGADEAVAILRREVERLYGRHLARQRTYRLEDDLRVLATTLASWELDH